MKPADTRTCPRRPARGESSLLWMRARGTPRSLHHGQPVERWLGIDVGGKRKGFDAALIDESRLLKLAGRLTTEWVVGLVESARPSVVAIDSPRRCAPIGEASREGERLVAKSICGIRWTPDELKVHRRPYYAWIVEGLALFRRLGVTGRSGHRGVPNRVMDALAREARQPTSIRLDSRRPRHP